MHDKTIIAKMRQLKTLEPGRETMETIKRRVYREAGISRSTHMDTLFSLYTQYLTPVYGALGVILVFLGISYMLFTANPMPKTVAMVNTATLSLESAHSSEAVVREEKNLDRAQKEIAALNLNGVPGKYTREECHVAYTKYEAYIRRYKEKIQEFQSQNSSPDPKLDRISEKIYLYEAQAEIKWPSMK